MYIFAASATLHLLQKSHRAIYAKMLEETKEEEEQAQDDLEDIEVDAEDTLEKFKAARKKVEEQLGLSGEFNEDELKSTSFLKR